MSVPSAPSSTPPTPDHATPGDSADRWRRVLAVAARQAGLISIGQLRTLGIPRRTIERWHAVGRLTRRHRGVYVVGPPQHGFILAAWAAQLAVGRASPLSHLTAAFLLGLTERRPTTVDVTVPGARRRSRQGVRVHHTRVDDLDPPRRDRHGLLVTGPRTTLIATAAMLDPALLRQAARAAMVDHHVDLAALATRIAGQKRRGTTRLREALLAVDDPSLHRTRSEFERRFLTFLREHDLPLPLVNALLLGYETDFHWPYAALVVETDGDRWHVGDDRRRQDRERDATHIAAGWTVLRIGWHQLEETPKRLAAQLRARLLPPTTT
ncbi:MAG: type IV toxin-antitoxin system AbiEi family antitoxin domain-containing protein [Solirubrobacteraceae bacterium]